jgi:hypothetical protein
VRISLARLPAVRVVAASLALAIAAVILSRPDPRPLHYIWGGTLIVAALAAFAWRHYFDLDAATNVLRRRMSLFFPWTIGSIPIADVKSIVLVTAARRNGKRSRTVYVLRVNSPRGTEILEHPDLWRARNIAEAVCRAIDRTFDNRMLRVSSQREAASLDSPLAELWRTQGRAANPPTLDPNSTLHVERRSDGTVLSLPVRFATSPAVAALAASILGVLAVAVVFATAEARFVLGMMGLFTAVVLVSAILPSIGRSTLRFSPTHVTHRQGWHPLATRMPLAEIEELIEADQALHLVSDKAHVRVDFAGNEADDRYVREFIAFEVIRRQTMRPLREPGSEP